MSKDTGGPAFPHEFKFGDGTANRADGMTLRDYFAAKAMQGLIVGVDKPGTSYIAYEAYKMADAMLEARK